MTSWLYRAMGCSLGLGTTNIPNPLLSYPLSTGARVKPLSVASPFFSDSSHRPLTGEHFASLMQVISVGQSKAGSIRIHGTLLFSTRKVPSRLLPILASLPFSLSAFRRDPLRPNSILPTGDTRRGQARSILP